MTESIVRDGETGRAIVSSTGTPVDDILDAIESTGTVQGALRLHPGLTSEAVAAALRFARVAVRREVKYTPDPGFGASQVREVALREHSTSHQGGEAVNLDPEAGVLSSLRAADRRRDQLRYELDLIESIRGGLQDVLDGNVIAHEEVVARLRARFPG